jgi:predicted PurR-regulated permease PerM
MGAMIGVLIGGLTFGLVGAVVGVILGWVVVASVLKRWSLRHSNPNPESPPAGSA